MVDDIPRVEIERLMCHSRGLRSVSKLFEQCDRDGSSERKVDLLAIAAESGNLLMFQEWLDPWLPDMLQCPEKCATVENYAYLFTTNALCCGWLEVLEWLMNYFSPDVIDPLLGDFVDIGNAHLNDRGRAELKRILDRWAAGKK